LMMASSSGVNEICMRNASLIQDALRIQTLSIFEM
jgi:hypothetical protein